MFAAALLAATLALFPPQRVADFRTGATSENETVLAVDAERAITWRKGDHTIRSVPLRDPATAKTLVAGVDDNVKPAIAPPLMAWIADGETHVAPIEAPESQTRYSGNGYPFDLQCNTAVCLLRLAHQCLIVGLDGKRIANVNPPGAMLAADPGGFLLWAGAAGETTGMFVTRIDNSGATTFKGVLPMPYAPLAAAGLFDGTRYVLVWTDFIVGTAPKMLRASFLETNGSFAPPVALGVTDVFNLSIACGPLSYLVAFNTYDGMTQVKALRLDFTLRAIDSQPFVINDTPQRAHEPHVAPTSNGGFVVGWSHAHNDTGYDPEAAFVDVSGQVSPRMILSEGIVPQGVSSATTTTYGMVVAWRELPNEDAMPTIRLRHLYLDGTRLGPPISFPDATLSAMAARYNATLFVWERQPLGEPAALRAAIVFGDGQVHDVVLPPIDGIPSVAASANGWLLAVAEKEKVTTIAFDGNGNALTPHIVASQTGVNFNAAIASDGNRFLVVWSATPAAGSSACGNDLCVARAELLDATGGLLANPGPLGDSYGPLAVAFAGDEYVVAIPALFGTSGIRRVTREGKVIDDFPTPVSGLTAHIAPYGRGVMVTAARTDGEHLIVYEHGAIAADMAVAVSPSIPQVLTSAAIVYKDGENAVVFRRIGIGRRQAAAASD